MTTTDILDIDFQRLVASGDALLHELDRLREDSPVFWSRSANAWIVTRHEDVSLGFSGSLPLSTERFSTMTLGNTPIEEVLTALPTLAASVPHWIVNMDPPRHTRLRKLMTRAFSRKVIEDLRPFARATIERVLGGISAPCEMDFVDNIARAITGRIILHLFGLPQTHLASLQNWSRALNTAVGTPQPPMSVLRAAEATLREMRDVFLPAIEARKLCPSNDFLTQLVQATDGDDRLTDEEVMGICYVALIAGHDTTMNSMSLGLETLTRHPGQIQFLISNRADIVNSIVEISRLSAMSTAQARRVAADFEWHGQSLRSGEVVLLMIAAANRDPRVFENPLALDLSRPTERVVTFAPGLHHCVGHLLAKMQLGEFFPAFLERFDAQITDESLQFIPSIVFRGLDAMNVRLTPKLKQA